MPRSTHNFYVANIALKGFVDKLLKGKKMSLGYFYTKNNIGMSCITCR